MDLIVKEKPKKSIISPKKLIKSIKQFAASFFIQGELSESIHLKLYDKHNLLDEKDSYKYTSFTMSYIAIASLLMAADKEINEAELSCLINSFNVPDLHHQKIYDLVEMATESETNYIQYAINIMQLFPSNSSLFKELIINLIKIAIIDEPQNIYESSIIKKICAILDITNEEYLAILRTEIFRQYNNDKLKLSLSYLKRIMRKYHPDYLVRFSDISPEYLEIANDRFIDLNYLYKSMS